MGARVAIARDHVHSTGARVVTARGDGKVRSLSLSLSHYPLHLALPCHAGHEEDLGRASYAGYFGKPDGVCSQ